MMSRSVRDSASDQTRVSIVLTPVGNEQAGPGLFENDCFHLRTAFCSSSFAGTGVRIASTEHSSAKHIASMLRNPGSA
jgi:hypothetical protein